jgi:hypothetical protein
MAAVCSSETPMNFNRTTQRYIPEGNDIQEEIQTRTETWRKV